ERSAEAKETGQRFVPLAGGDVRVGERQGGRDVVRSLLQTLLQLVDRSPRLLGRGRALLEEGHPEMLSRYHRRLRKELPSAHMGRVLISGITGQDGSYLTEALLADGDEVHGLVRQSSHLLRT